jgi:ribosomal protein S18 acetylase RimI-like enzyme
VTFLQDGLSAQAALERIAQVLDETALLRPVSDEREERRLWLDHDLASMAENRLGVSVDPERLGDDRRRDLLERATLDGEGLRTEPTSYFRRYWILDGSERVGTLATATHLLGRSTLGISSLYVVPARRRRGHAERVLDAVYAASVAAGLAGTHLSTDWSWQPAVRFYLKRGFWVRGWKRSLDLIRRRDLPDWRIRIDGDCASFVATIHGRERTLIQARRAGDRLVWVDMTSTDPTGDDGFRFHAAGTFALALAVRGFPLLTGEEAWRQQLAAGFSDCGGPEGLAFKIRRFEAWDRKHGWLTPAPRIAGLDYPDWDDVD